MTDEEFARSQYVASLKAAVEASMASEDDPLLVEAYAVKYMAKAYPAVDLEQIEADVEAEVVAAYKATTMGHA